MPKQALPESVRKSLGLKDKRSSSKRFNNDSIEIAAEVHRTKGGTEAKAYLKMKSGVPMSIRTSGLAQSNGGRGVTGIDMSKKAFGGGGAKQRRSQPQEQLAVIRRQQQRRASGGQPSRFALVREQPLGEITYDTSNARTRTKAPVKPASGWR